MHLLFAIHLCLNFLAPPTDSEVHLTIENVKYTDGPLYIFFFRPEDEFLSKKPYKKFKVNPAKGNMVVKLNVPAGRYGIGLHHDLNNNGVMDKNLIGIPKEPYGVSKYSGGLSRPKFEESAVEIGPNTKISIALHEM